MAAPARRYITLEEYERLERESETKNEWFNGEIVAMSGATFDHIVISHNLLAILLRKLEGGPCRAFLAELRVRADRLRAYPDLVVVCGKPQLDPSSKIATVENPVVLVEVLSPSTEAFDRGEKFGEYRGIESLRDYVLISQDHMLVEHFARHAEGRWVYTALQLPTAEVVLTGAEARIPVGDIYEGVTFPSRPLPDGHSD